MGAPGEEKKENFRNRTILPCRHHVTAHFPGLIYPPPVTSRNPATRRTRS